MRLLKLATVAALFTASVSSVNASSVRDDIPSCYPILAGHYDQQVSPPKRSLTVVIDQTLPLPQALRQSVSDKVLRFLEPGDKLNIISFSALFEENYTDLTFTGSLDPALPREAQSSIGKRTLKKFDICNIKQTNFVKKIVPAKLAAAFKGGTSDLPNTELVGSLHEIGSSVITNDNSEEKILLIVSDMLENSSTVSFYRGGMKKALPVEKYVSTFKEKSLIPDLAGVKVYVMGAGTLPEGGKYRSQEYMLSLKQFWTRWASDAGASMEGWGQPSLMQDLR